MITRRRCARSAALLFLIATLPTLIGCAAAAIPATTLLSVGAGTANQGYAVWQGNRLRYVVELGLDEVVDGVYEAVDRMDLTLDADRTRERDGVIVKRHFAIENERGHMVAVSAVRLTEEITAVTVSAGFLGNRANAEFMVEQIQPGRIIVYERDQTETGE